MCFDDTELAAAVGGAGFEEKEGAAGSGFGIRGVAGVDEGGGRGGGVEVGDVVAEDGLIEPAGGGIGEFGGVDGEGLAAIGGFLGEVALVVGNIAEGVIGGGELAAHAGVGAEGWGEGEDVCFDGLGGLAGLFEEAGFVAAVGDFESGAEGFFAESDVVGEAGEGEAVEVNGAIEIGEGGCGVGEGAEGAASFEAAGLVEGGGEFDLAVGIGFAFVGEEREGGFGLLHEAGAEGGGVGEVLEFGEVFEEDFAGHFVEDGAVGGGLFLLAEGDDETGGGEDEEGAEGEGWQGVAGDPFAEAVGGAGAVGLNGKAVEGGADIEGEGENGGVSIPRVGRGGTGDDGGDFVAGLAGEEMAEDDAEGVEIAEGGGDGVGLFGAGEGGGGEVRRVMAVGAGDAEVDDFDVAGGVDEDVVGFEVAVNDAVEVGVVDGIAGVEEEVEFLACRECAGEGGDGLGAFDVFHDEEVGPVGGGAGVEEAGDVGMFEAGEDGAFAVKEIDEAGGEGGGDEFDGDGFGEGLIGAFGEIDGAHTAFTDEVEEFVVAGHLPGAGGRGDGGGGEAGEAVGIGVAVEDSQDAGEEIGGGDAGLASGGGAGGGREFQQLFGELLDFLPIGPGHGKPQ